MQIPGMGNPLDTGYYLSDDLRSFGFKRVGENVRISKTCTVVGADNIEIGDHVQIDSFTSIIAHKGYLRLGSYIHICTSVLLGCRGGVTMGDFTAISHGGKVISASDDFGGDWLMSTCVPEDFQNADVRPVFIDDHSAVLMQGVVLPGVTMAQGTILGCMGLASRDLAEPWTMYGGVPARPIKARTRRAADLGAQLLHYAVAAE